MKRLVLTDSSSATIKYLWNIMSFPEAALLGKRIPKKQFLESGQLSSGDKKLFRENVKSIHWEYTLKPSTCSVLPFKDSEREYLEVAIIQVELASTKSHKRIAELIHQAIPYPLMLGLFTETNQFALSIAPKRYSQAEQGAYVTERVFITSWLNSKKLSEQEMAFITSFVWNDMSVQHYDALYNAWIDRFTGYECSGLSGTFTVDDADDRLEILIRCREIESIISEQRTQLKKAAFNQQVELNVQIKKLEHELKQLVLNL